MDGYLGTFPVKIEDTEYINYSPADWALYFVGSYGQIDGGHHKLWVLDQVARILHGTPIDIVEARWDNGHTEYRISTGEPSQEYLQWVIMMKDPWDEENEEFTYYYDVGVPP
jgi:hypothetical protein